MYGDYVFVEVEEIMKYHVLGCFFVGACVTWGRDSLMPYLRDAGFVRKALLRPQ